LASNYNIQANGDFTGDIDREATHRDFDRESTHMNLT